MPGTPVSGRMWSRLSMCCQVGDHLLVAAFASGALIRRVMTGSWAVQCGTGGERAGLAWCQ